jgi:uncharacterized protein DUF4129
VPTPSALRAALDSVFASPAYRWTEEPAPWRLLREEWQRLVDWLRAIETANPGAFRIFVAVLVVGLLLVLGHAGWVVWRTVRGAVAANTPRAPSAPRETRDARWYLGQADRAAAAGRFLEALQLAFIGLALTLDGQGLLRYDPSKTPAECARDARLAPADRERLRELVRALYAHAFGGRPCRDDDYRRWRGVAPGPWRAAGH